MSRLLDKKDEILSLVNNGGSLAVDKSTGEIVDCKKWQYCSECLFAGDCKAKMIKWLLEEEL